MKPYPFGLKLPAVIVLSVGLGIVLALIILYIFQRNLIYYHRPMARTTYTRIAANAVGHRVTIIPQFDALVIPPPQGGPVTATAILFHGNAGSALSRLFYAAPFNQRGIRLILAEYPGFSVRTGVISQESLVADADALYRKVEQLYPDGPVILVGESLGTGVASQVVAKHTQDPRLKRVVLITPFVSLAETAGMRVWFLPVRYLVKDTFESAKALEGYHGESSLLIAGKDETVGAGQGIELANDLATHSRTSVVEIPGAGHNTWLGRVSQEQWTQLIGREGTKAQ